MRHRLAVAAAAAALGAGIVLALPAPAALTTASTDVVAGMAPAAASCRVPAGRAPVPASAVVTTRGLAFADGPGGPVRLDVVAPRNGETARPTVVVVHGGGWYTGSRAGMTRTAERLARAGFVAVNIDYTLTAPGRAGFPRQLDEVRAAVRYARAHAARFGIDPRRIGALGSSAGGHLVTLLAATTTNCTAGDGVAAAVAWSAPTDLTAYPSFGRDECNARCRALAPRVEQFVGCAYDACPERWATASPGTHASAGDPPVLLFHSEDEFVPLSQATSLDAALARAGVPHGLVVYPGSRHASGFADDAMPATIAFLTRYLD